MVIDKFGCHYGVDTNDFSLLMKHAEVIGAPR